MGNFILLVIVGNFLLLLSGCMHHGVKDFEKSEYSGVKASKVEVALIEKYPKWDDSDFLHAYFNENKPIADKINQGCSPDVVPMVTPVLIPIISSFGQLIFDSYIDSNIREVQALKKAAQGSYSGTAIVDSESFIKQKCVVLVRYAKNANSLGMLAVIKIIPKSKDAFVFQPLYVRAMNSSVITNKGKKENGILKPPTINVSLGLAIKTIGNNKLGVPSLLPVGEGVVSVPNLQIGPNAPAYVCEKVCESSDLIPYPNEKMKTLSLSMSINETGQVGINIEQRAAELKALKEAMGPAIKDATKEYFTEDD